VPTGLPVRVARVSSQFGSRTHPMHGRTSWHSGVDLAVPSGTPVTSTEGGRVRSAGWSGNYGLLVVVEHGNGVQTRYAHLSSLAVSAGDEIEAGQRLGLSGSTGRSTGPHVHYEVRVDGRPVDPLR
jgi:murein DD-endopeptidase MepM/ murein hydrolase activator NlpD